MRRTPCATTTLLLLLLLLLAMTAFAPAIVACRFPALFIFGDSLSDSGNCVRYRNRFQSFLICDRTLRLPYGCTFPSGGFPRFSDGRLIIDFLATFVGLPFINSYLNHEADFTAGANYALSGATALSTRALRSRLIPTLTNTSIADQLIWHMDLKSKAESKLPGMPASSAFSQGLYVIETGGDDYLAALYTRKRREYVMSSLIPSVIASIRTTTEALYSAGARNFLYISITPLGCIPFILSTRNGAKDADGCYEPYNELSYLHGAMLHAEVKDLRIQHPDANFTFLDYYGVYQHILENHAAFGFTNTLDACCGAGPGFRQNFSFLQVCNNRTSTVCSDPNRYLNWDGFHFTDAFNHEVFQQTVVAGTYLDPSDAFKHCALSG